MDLIAYQNIFKHNKQLKTFSIISIVLSSIYAVISIVALVYLFIAFSTLGGSESVVNAANNSSMPYGTYVNGGELVIGASSASLDQLTKLGLYFMLSISSFIFLSSVYCLIINIVGLKQLKTNKHVNSMYILHIFGIIVSLISLAILRTISIFICCVFYYKVKKIINAQANNLQ